MHTQTPAFELAFFCLLDISNKRMINADAKLKEVFGKPQVSMFEMAKLIGAHVS